MPAGGSASRFFRFGTYYADFKLGKAPMVSYAGSVGPLYGSNGPNTVGYIGYYWDGSPIPGTFLTSFDFTIKQWIMRELTSSPLPDGDPFGGYSLNAWCYDEPRKTLWWTNGGRDVYGLDVLNNVSYGPYTIPMASAIYGFAGIHSMAVAGDYLYTCTGAYDGGLESFNVVSKTVGPTYFPWTGLIDAEEPIARLYDVNGLLWGIGGGIHSVRVFNLYAGIVTTFKPFGDVIDSAYVNSVEPAINGGAWIIPSQGPDHISQPRRWNPETNSLSPALTIDVGAGKTVYAVFEVRGLNREVYFEHLIDIPYYDPYTGKFIKWLDTGTAAYEEGQGLVGTRLIYQNGKYWEVSGDYGSFGGFPGIYEMKNASRGWKIGDI